jgi:PAS domain S-box-containing protein
MRPKVAAARTMEITRLRSQLSLAFERLAALLQRAWGTLARVARATADELQEARRATENGLRRLEASLSDAVAVTKPKISRFRSQLSLVFEQLAALLQRAWGTLTRVARATADELQEARRATENGVRRLLGSLFDAIVVTNKKIGKVGSQLITLLQQVVLRFQRAQSALARFGRSVVDKPRRLQEARHARENDLRTLLASSLDAVIVTDNDRRFVAANSQALDLFGISESNMGKFTIGTFLSPGQILTFDRNRSPFMKQEERHGKCKIRRLDGSLRVAECIFVANVVFRRHLYRFQNVALQKANPLRMPVSYEQETRKPFDIRPSITKQLDQQ